MLGLEKVEGRGEGHGRVLRGEGSVGGGLLRLLLLRLLLLLLLLLLLVHLLLLLLLLGVLLLSELGVVAAIRARRLRSRSVVRERRWWVPRQHGGRGEVVDGKGDSRLAVFA